MTLLSLLLLNVISTTLYLDADVINLLKIVVKSSWKTKQVKILQKSFLEFAVFTILLAGAPLS